MGKKSGKGSISEPWERCPALRGAFSPGPRLASLQSLATLRDSAASRRLGGARKARSAQRLGGEERSKVRVRAWSKRQYSSLKAIPQEVTKTEALVPMRMEFIVELGCVCPRKQILRRMLLRCPRSGWCIWKSCWIDKV